jgi:two-component system phosphate regulon response regulator PhoB
MGATKTILIIDDDTQLAELVACALSRSGFRYLVAPDGLAGLEAVRRHLPDLVLIGFILPGLSGADICTLLKRDEKTASIPVVFMTSKSVENHRIAGLEAGADDCVDKPFSVRELLLRIKAILRCNGDEETSRGAVTAGPISVDTERHIVAVDGKEVALTMTEYKIIISMIERLGEIISREMLMREVRGITNAQSARTIDTHITRIRTKLGTAGDLIKTVRSRGYRFEAGAAIPCGND